MKPDLKRLRELCEDRPGLSVVQCWVSQEKADRQKHAEAFKALPQLLDLCEEQAKEIALWKARAEKQGDRLYNAGLEIDKMQAVVEAAEELQKDIKRTIDLNVNWRGNGAMSTIVTGERLMNFVEALSTLTANRRAG